jgi:SAM-dependent methyltransferase
MRLLINQFVKICAETLPCPEPVVEFGAFQVPGQEAISNLRAYFPNKKYVGADMRMGPGVDVVLNLHHIDLPSESFGTVLMMDTLEHVEFPRKAIDEIYRVLKPGGILLMSSVMNFPIHDYPSDYWRFTPEAFKSLLKPFPHAIVVAAGENLFPHTIVGVGFKGPSDGLDLSGFHRDVDSWEQYWTGATRPQGFNRFLKYLTRLDAKIKKVLSRK